MKVWFVVFSLTLTVLCIGQDTLYLPVPALGHEKFILKNNKTFIYQSDLCGYRFVSVGTFRKTLLGYRFNCDTIGCPEQFSLQEKTGTDTSSVCISFYDFLDSTRIDYWGEISIAGVSYTCEGDSLKISKKDLPCGSILLRLERNEEFLIDKNYTTVKLFLESPGWRCGDNHIRQLRKTSHGYLLREVVYDENRNKPWKKHKRIVRHYFNKLNKKP